MSGYIGAVPVPEATQNRTSYTATAGQTTFAVDYTVGFIDVFLNGIKLANEDFTATNGSSVVLASAAAVNDILDTISYTAFNPADTVAASTGGTFGGNVTFGGNAVFGDNNKALFGAGSDLQVYHDGSDSYVDDAGTGALILRGNSNVTIGKYTGETMGFFEVDGAVSLYHNNAIKMATSASGIDITGGVSIDDDNNFSFGDGTAYIQGSGANDRLKFITSNSEAMRIDSGGNVGIGTSSPASLIHGMSGDLFLTANSTSADSGQGLYFQSTTSGWATNVAHAAIFGKRVDASNGYLKFDTRGSGTTAERMRIGATGEMQLGGTTNAGFIDFDGSSIQLNTQRNPNTGAFQNTGRAHTTIGMFDGNGTAANSYIKFGTASANNTVATERMRIDSSGNVSIGGFAPKTWSLGKALHVGNAENALWGEGDYAFHMMQNAHYNAGWKYTHSDEANRFALEDGKFVWATASAGTANAAISFSERMRLTNDGNLLVGTTSASAKITSSAVGGTAYSASINASGSGMQVTSQGFSNTMTALTFRTNYGAVGSITCGSATAYNTSSDYRLKTDVQPMVGATARVQALNPVNFEWIASGDRVDGFLAHEAQAVVPECVTGTKDAMKDEEYQVSAATGDIYTPATDAYVDEDGNDVDAVDEVIHSANAEQPETLEDGQQWRETTAAVMGARSVPDMQGIDQSKMVPLLTAALREALTEITALKTRVAALENA